VSGSLIARETNRRADQQFQPEEVSQPVTAPSPVPAAALRSLLNGWDPIGILGSVPDPPEDEYDRLLAPVAFLLAGPYPRERLTGYLRDEMAFTFALDPDLVGVEAFVAELLHWRPPRAPEPWQRFDADRDATEAGLTTDRTGVVGCGAVSRRPG